ncbi:GNAT family N-acetyltransferase [Serinibacter salmoneus]|uniref:RimJ/RimL family protein N-acetyltransferase n=1 Tax=Serinibacter salmoneus TaxID=556530 RepID=A0A2A9D453_9MICO|nr:GNAT family protein [Serinibacter salmoneus]PFG20630.1 RimJ/RimL family protein N-acetyltransferase [Serinibacter salmoneus]
MRAALRPWHADDAFVLSAVMLQASDLHVQVGESDLSTPLLAKRFIDEALRSDERARHWAIVWEEEVVGNVSLSAIERRHGTCWASYWTVPRARGRGLAARALAGAAQWAFERDLYRVELGHRTNNPASCAVARRAGFPVEGLEREKLRYGEERFDVELHARLRTDPTPPIAALALLENP